MNIQLDVVYEHERGIMLLKPIFSKKYLLPTDPPSWSRNGIQISDIQYQTSLDGWDYISDWQIEMTNILVDDQGWSYHTLFSPDNWTSSPLLYSGSVVRRRKWTRMKRATNRNHESVSILSLLQSITLEKEKLESLRVFLETRIISDPVVVQSILKEFQFDCLALKACFLITSRCNSKLVVDACLKTLLFASDKLQLLQHLG